MKQLALLLTFILFLSFEVKAVPVSLGNYNCNSPRSLNFFDQNLQQEFNLRFEGDSSCRADGNRTYTQNFPSPIPLAGNTFTISFYQRNNAGNSISIRGVLQNGTEVAFSRSSGGPATGIDGAQWFLITYTYQGGSQTGNMVSAKWTTNNQIVWFDKIESSSNNPLSNERYLKMQPGYENIFISFNLDDVLANVQKINTYRMTGRFNANDYAELYALDASSLNPDVYVQCDQVTFTSITPNPSDATGSSYSIECIPPTLVGAQRGLFRITNNGTTPLNPVEFVVEVRTLPKILETARSANFNYVLSIKTTVYP